MMRLTLLCLFAFIAATLATDSFEINEVPVAGPFSRYQSFTGVVSFSRIGDVSSCPVKPWTPEQTEARVKKMTVPFPKPYASFPAVSFAVSSLDVDKNYNLRYRVNILDVTKTDFTIEFNVWCNTYIYSAQVTYWIIGGKTKKPAPPPPGKNDVEVY
eukprot:g7302.t1